MPNAETSTPETLRPWSESLDTLRTVADLSESLTLVFVVGPGGRAGQALAQIGALLGDRRTVLWHRVDRDGADLASTLETAEDPARSVLLVHGLELVEDEERRILARTLNLRRDALSPYKSIIAFWIAQDYLKDFRRLCSDFFHWRSLLITLTDEELEADVVTRWRYIDAAVRWLKERIRNTYAGGESLVEVEGRPTSLSLRTWATRTSRGRLVSPRGSQSKIALLRFALDQMRRARSEILEPLPIWMPLEEAQIPAREEEVAAILGACPGGRQLSVAVLESWIRHGDLHFILDGLAELPRDLRSSWQGWIDRQRIRYPGNRFLVTATPSEEPVTGWDRATVISPRRETRPAPRRDKGRPTSLSLESRGQSVIRTSRPSHSRKRAASLPSLLRDLDPRRSADSLVRAQAARSLGRRGGARAVSALIRSLDPELEPAGTVRVSAAKALGRMEDRRAADALTRSLDPGFEIDGAVRRAQRILTQTIEGPVGIRREALGVPTVETAGVAPRSGHTAIHRGYLYQTYIGILRWLDLEDGETLVVEGDEDLDRLLSDGTGVSEQVKAYQGNVLDQTVRDSLRAFAVAYSALRRDGISRRFVFTTPVEKRRPRPGTLGLLEDWDAPHRRDHVVAELREILPKADDPRLARAIAWLNARPRRWSDFVDAVEWRFGAPRLDQARTQILTKLRERGFQPTEAWVDRLVAELFQASRQQDVARRRRTSKDLDALLRTIGDDLAGWSVTPEAERLRAALDESEDIGRLLHDGTRPLPVDPTPGQMLAAAHEIVPFHTEGRRAELDVLAAWCSAEPRASVWLWTGQGGVGKTRLMIEWCRRLRAQGWHAGFLHHHLDDGIERLFKGTVARLIVIDYAETRFDAIRPLLFRVATVGDGPRLRVILLARQRGDWWRALRHADEEVKELIAASPEPRRLGSLDMDRGAAFGEALLAFAEASGGGDGELPAPTLEGADYDRVLHLHMAALAAIGGKPVGGADDALTETLEREQGFWFQRIRELDLEDSQKELLGKAVPRAVTALTLTGGVNDAHALPLIAEATQSLALTNLARSALSELLRSLYGDGREFGGLEPDLLGEELVASCLAEEAGLSDRVLDVADERGRAEALALLTRLARRRPEEERWLARAFEEHLEELAEPALAVAVEIGDPVGRVLAGFVGEAPGELAKRLMKRCDADDYSKSVPLREIACEATRRYLEYLQQRWPEPDEEQLAELSLTASNLGVRLNALGRREEALEATREAIENRRRLVAARPGVFLPDLAQSLNNLGVWLSDLGHRKEALVATREAVDIRRRLAASRPDPFLPDLAQSLNNLGIWLSDMERPEEALEVIREAVEIRRRLAASQTDAFLPDLSSSLNNLGNRLGDLGHRERALSITREAVEIRRRLAMSRPDIFLPDLAASLDNLGNRFSDLEHHEEALDFTREAVEIRRRLAAERPDAFLPDLATSLNNLGNRLSDLGRHEEALEAATEAVRTLAPYFERLPEAFAGWMRVMAKNYRKRADDAGRPADGELLGPILAELARLSEDG